jgi:hypothetical protein
MLETEKIALCGELAFEAIMDLSQYRPLSEDDVVDDDDGNNNHHHHHHHD